MSRNRASAKAAGTSFERLVADYLRGEGFPFADRRVKTGANDKGDVGGVLTRNARGEPAGVVVECKDYGGRLEAAAWLREAETERLNASALVGLVVAKRRGTRVPGDQYVLMSMRDLVALLTGERGI